MRGFCIVKFVNLDDAVRLVSSANGVGVQIGNFRVRVDYSIKQSLLHSWRVDMNGKILDPISSSSRSRRRSSSVERPKRSRRFVCFFLLIYFPN